MTHEFSMLPEVACDLGRSPKDLPSARRLEVQHGSQTISGVLWGEDAPELVFLHGGGQNARTWDAVAIELGRSALALDLPGHGFSSWRTDHNYSASANAPSIANAIKHCAPEARLVVGMSLGGLTVAALANEHPRLVNAAILIDILPDLDSQTSNPDRERLARLRQASAQRFHSREEMVEQVAALARRRSRKILQRGVFHNSVQDPDGMWRWRYDPQRISYEQEEGGNERLWQGVAQLPVGSTLLRGQLSTFVGSESLERLQDVGPHVKVETIADAGHSIQGDQPKILAQRLRAILAELKA